MPKDDASSDEFVDDESGEDEGSSASFESEEDEVMTNPALWQRELGFPVPSKIHDTPWFGPALCERPHF